MTAAETGTKERQIGELPEGTEFEQPRLFDPPAPGRGQRGPLTPTPVAPLPSEVSGDSSLSVGITWFHDQLSKRKYSENTRRSYARATDYLLRCFGQSHRLREISVADMERFANWMLSQKRSAKTKEITITAVRTFFRFLEDAEIIPYSPVADIYFDRVDSPAPRLLHDAQVDALRKAAAAEATTAEVPDTVPQLLLCLLLDLGLRLGEVDRLQVDDIDLSIPLRPVVEICYNEDRHRGKRRRLLGPPQLSSYLDAYLRQYTFKPNESRLDNLLHCARRGLQAYITALGDAAGLGQPLTANRLRWTYAAAQWREGIPAETMRARLGVSVKRWEYMSRKLDELTKRPV